MIYYLIPGPLENRAWGNTSTRSLHLWGCNTRKQKWREKGNESIKEGKIYKVVHYCWPQLREKTQLGAHSWYSSLQKLHGNIASQNSSGGRGGRSIYLPVSSHLLFFVGQILPTGTRTPPYFLVVTQPSGQLLHMPKPMSAKGASSE